MKGGYNCIVVLGPTASGKTRLACQLAGMFNGEIISADSRQVYRQLDIGTGKELHTYHYQGKPVRYHLIDVAEPAKQFFLHDFAKLLAEAFTDITGRGKLPVICGGTGLYLDTLRKDFSLTQVPENIKLRKELGNLSKPELLERLSRYPKAQIAQVDNTSLKRMIRGIEIAEYLSSNVIMPPQTPPYVPFYLGIDPPRETVMINIKTRLHERLENGMVEEVESLVANGVSYERLRSLGLEYKHISRYVQGEISYDQMREDLAVAIRQFAKRQMTWFRRMQRQGVDITWLNKAELTESVTQVLTGFFSR